MVTTAIAGDTFPFGARPPGRARAVGCGAPLGGTALASVSTAGPVETGPPCRRSGTAPGLAGTCRLRGRAKSPHTVAGRTSSVRVAVSRVRAASVIRPGLSTSRAAVHRSDESAPASGVAREARSMGFRPVWAVLQAAALLVAAIATAPAAPPGGATIAARVATEAGPTATPAAAATPLPHPEGGRAPPLDVEAPGDVPGYSWPLRPPPAVLTPFGAPEDPFGPGHRGVDLAGTVGQPVLAARGGTVVFAGLVAGQGVVSVQHDDGLRTTYEPLVPAVQAGAVVATGDVLGALSAGHRGCALACLHWGVRRDRLEYLDPLVLVRPPWVRLLPVPDPWPDP